jgi:surface protein
MTSLSYGAGVATANNKLKLVQCLSFGNIGLTTLANAFQNCSNLTKCPASLPGTVTSLGQTFHGCSRFNDPDITKWNTSRVTNMSQTFRLTTVFNQPIGSWNTSSVTTLSGIFFVATAFNQPIDSWNTSSVTDMSQAFQLASSFNQPLDSWNTSSVNNMNSMFQSALVFNQPIGSWNTASVNNMSLVFSGASAFNQNIGSWNTAAVRTMQSMFSNASAFNQPIGSWNVASVNNMQQMFQNASSFNQDISSWNTGAVTTMQFMFINTSVFNQPIGSWNTASVNNMGSMFANNVAFSQDISNWDIRKVTNMIDILGGFWGTANYDAALVAWADLADIDLPIGTTANTSQAITAFATLSAGTQTRVTSNAHGLVAGSRVNISGTTNYNGDYNVLAAAANTFDIAKAFVANDATGTMRHRRSRNVTAGFGINKYSAGTPATKRGVLTGTYLWSITDGGQV